LMNLKHEHYISHVICLCIFYQITRLFLFAVSQPEDDFKDENEDKEPEKTEIILNVSLLF
jgi:hypothetical protein